LVEARGRTRFIEESREVLLDEAKLCGHQLERDASTQLGVACEVDLAHPSATEQPAHAELLDLGPGGKLGGLSRNARQAEEVDRLRCGPR
jgi:hypothetical protein